MELESLHDAYHRDPPDSLHDDVLLERIRRFRRDRQLLASKEQETQRMKLESLLAELESEALKRGLR